MRSAAKNRRRMQRVAQTTCPSLIARVSYWRKFESIYAKSWLAHSSFAAVHESLLGRFCCRNQNDRLGRIAGTPSECEVCASILFRKASELTDTRGLGLRTRASFS